MYVEQYDAVRGVILDANANANANAHADGDETGARKHIVAVAQDRLGEDELFPTGRLTNSVRCTKTDMEARCEVECIPGSSPQRVTRWRAH